MKKVFIVIASFLLIGCSLTNTPTSKVESFLNNYINLSDDVALDIEKTSLNENLNDENRETYKNVLSKQYEGLKYEIKNESIDGDNAIVTVNINIYDLYKIEKESVNYMHQNMNDFYDSDGNFSNELFNTYRLNNLINAEDRIDYEINFYLDKKNDEWVLRNPDKATLEKINGLYNYDEN